MPPSIWDVFRALSRWGEKTEVSSEETDERRFVPSPLDLSVRIGHGGADDDVVRELSKIDEQARELEDSQRGN